MHLHLHSRSHIQFNSIQFQLKPFFTSWFFLLDETHMLHMWPCVRHFSKETTFKTKTKWNIFSAHLSIFPDVKYLFIFALLNYNLEIYSAKNVKFAKETKLEMNEKRKIGAKRFFSCREQWNHVHFNTFSLMVSVAFLFTFAFIHRRQWFLFRFPICLARAFFLLVWKY